MRYTKSYMKDYPISSICRIDLEKCFSISEIAKFTDADMERLASKMGDDYCNQMYWESMEILARDILDNK